MKQNEEMHREHISWLQQLDFFQDEIRFFQNRLLQVVLKHIKTVNMEHVATFRTRFLDLLRLIDECRHIIVAHEAEIAQALQTPGTKVHGHSIMSKELNALDEKFDTLRKEFNQLLHTHPLR